MCKAGKTGAAKSEKQGKIVNRVKKNYNNIEKTYNQIFQ